MNQVEILDRGLVPYVEALEYQRSLARDLIEGRLDHDGWFCSNTLRW